MRVCYFASYRNIGYYVPESYNDVKDTNGNVAKADNCGSEVLGMNVGYYPPNPFIAIEQQSCQFYFDKVNGIMTIDTAYDVQEIRVFIKGYEKQFQRIILSALRKTSKREHEKDVHLVLLRRIFINSMGNDFMRGMEAVVMIF